MRPVLETRFDLSRQDLPADCRPEMRLPASNPQEVIREILGKGAKANGWHWREGFQHFMAQIPRLSPDCLTPETHVADTVRVMNEVRALVLQQWDSLRIPTVHDGKFERMVLAVEEPTRCGEQVVSGGMIVMGLWGRGMASPVHGHAQGLIHEELLSGKMTAHFFEQIGDTAKQEARYTGSDGSSDPRHLYTGYRFSESMGEYANFIHALVAVERSVTLHFLPEQPRNGVGNSFRVVNTPDSGNPQRSGGDLLTSIGGTPLIGSNVEQIEPSSLKEPGAFVSGDIFLARDRTAPQLGDHLIIAQKSGQLEELGFRPRGIALRIPADIPTALESLPIHQCDAIFKLTPNTAVRIHQHLRLEAQRSAVE